MRRVIFLSVLVILIPVIQPLFHPHIPGTADGLAHKFRLVSFGKAIEEGSWRPRWIADQALGYGSPIFLFNYMIPYYAIWIITKMGLSINLSTQLYQSFTLLISFAGMYLLVERLWGKLAGLTAATIYMYAPYHLMSIYLYEGWGEMTAFGWAPWILLFGVRVVDESTQLKNNQKMGILYTFLPFFTRNSLLLIIFWSFLILSHNVSAFMLTPVVLLLIFVYAQANIQRFLPVLKSFVATVSLTAFFWLPAIVLNSYTSYPSLIAAEIAMRGSFFKSLVTLWGNAFTTIQKGSVGYYDFTIGLPLFVIFGVGIVLLIFAVMQIICGSCLSLRRFAPLGKCAFTLSEEKSHPQLNYCLPAGKAGIIGSFLIFFLSLYLANYSSNWFWGLPLLHLIVYPFRFLFLATLVGSICAGWMVRKSLILSIVMIVLAILAGRPFTHPAIDYMPYDDSYFHQVNTILYAPGTQKNMATLEFLPVWADKDFLLSQEKKYVESGKLPEKFEFTSGQGKVTQSQFNQDSILAKIEVNQNARISLETFYFPNWKASLDGQSIPVTYDKYGRIEIKIPSGVHNMLLHFTLLPIEKLAWIISITASIIVLSQFLWNNKRNEKP